MYHSKHTEVEWGLSIVVCCYNSAARLPETLEHLCKQEISEPWEVVVVNNASRDDTAAVALAFAERLPVRVVDEPEPGLSHARHRGFTEARYEIIALVDDDNHVPPEWGKTMLNCFREHPEAAECGGPTVGVCEVEAPFWFEQFKSNFAVDAPFSEAGFVSRPLLGAGLGIRKAAWKELLDNGFVSLLSDRKGASLSSGGDFELGYAFLLLGWKLYYDPALELVHYMPKERLKWDYLCRLNEGFGRQSPVFDAYTSKLNNECQSLWIVSLLSSLWSMLRQLPAALRRREGDGCYLLWCSLKGRVAELLRRRGRVILPLQLKKR